MAESPKASFEPAKLDVPVPGRDFGRPYTPSPSRDVDDVTQSPSGSPQWDHASNKRDREDEQEKEETLHESRVKCLACSSWRSADDAHMTGAADEDEEDLGFSEKLWMQTHDDFSFDEMDEDADEDLHDDALVSVSLDDITKLAYHPSSWNPEWSEGHFWIQPATGKQGKIIKKTGHPWDASCFKLAQALSPELVHKAGQTCVIPCCQVDLFLRFYLCDLPEKAFKQKFLPAGSPDTHAIREYLREQGAERETDEIRAVKKLKETDDKLKQQGLEIEQIKEEFLQMKAFLKHLAQGTQSIPDEDWELLRGRYGDIAYMMAKLRVDDTLEVGQVVAICADLEGLVVAGEPSSDVRYWGVVANCEFIRGYNAAWPKPDIRHGGLKNPMRLDIESGVPVVLMGVAAVRLERPIPHMRPGSFLIAGEDGRTSCVSPADAASRHASRVIGSISEIQGSGAVAFVRINMGDTLTMIADSLRQDVDAVRADHDILNSRVTVIEGQVARLRLSSSVEVAMEFEDACRRFAANFALPDVVGVGKSYKAGYVLPHLVEVRDRDDIEPVKFSREECSMWFTEAEGETVHISGVSGVGKSSFAGYLLHHYEEIWPERFYAVWYVDCRREAVRRLVLEDLVTPHQLAKVTFCQEGLSTPTDWSRVLCILDHFEVVSHTGFGALLRQSQHPSLKNVLLCSLPSVKCENAGRSYVLVPLTFSQAQSYLLSQTDTADANSRLGLLRLMPAVAPTIQLLDILLRADLGKETAFDVMRSTMEKVLWSGLDHKPDPNVKQMTRQVLLELSKQDAGRQLDEDVASLCSDNFEQVHQLVVRRLIHVTDVDLGDWKWAHATFQSFFRAVAAVQQQTTLDVMLDPLSQVLFYSSAKRDVEELKAQLLGPLDTPCRVPDSRLYGGVTRYLRMLREQLGEWRPQVVLNCWRAAGLDVHDPRLCTWIHANVLKEGHETSRKVRRGRDAVLRRSFRSTRPFYVWCALEGLTEVIRSNLPEIRLDSSLSRDATLFLSASIITAAAAAGHLDIVEMMLEGAPCDIGREYFEDELCAAAPLFGAYLGGHARVVKFFCEKVDPTSGCWTSSNFNAVYGACGGGHVESFRELQDRFCDRIVMGVSTGQPLAGCIWGAQDHLFDILLQETTEWTIPRWETTRGDTRAKDKYSAVFLATRRGRLDLLRKMINAGLDVKCLTIGHLQAAGRGGNVQLIEYLRDVTGIDDTDAKDRMPCIVQAAYMGRVHAVRALVERNEFHEAEWCRSLSHPHRPKGSPWSPLYAAARGIPHKTEGTDRVVRYLLETFFQTSQTTRTQAILLAWDVSQGFKDRIPANETVRKLLKDDQQYWAIIQQALATRRREKARHQHGRPYKQPRQWRENNHNHRRWRK